MARGENDGYDRSDKTDISGHEGDQQGEGKEHYEPFPAPAEDCASETGQALTAFEAHQGRIYVTDYAGGSAQDPRKGNVPE